MDQGRVIRTRTHSLQPVDPTQIIGERVGAIRRYLGLTQQELAESMQAVGIGWQRVIVAKLESGRRSFVRVDELLALCLVLEISVVDLLVPKDVDDDRYYRVVPNGSARAVDVREWVRGEGLLFWRPYPEPEVDNSTPFASPTGKTSDPTLWMPGDRADRVAKRYEWDPEEADQ